MLVEEVVGLIRQDFPDAEIQVEGEDCSFSVVVISEKFEGLSLLKKQQAVLATVKAPLASGELHAMSVKAFTPAEWEKKRANTGML